MGTLAREKTGSQGARRTSRPTSKAPAQREKILELLRSRGSRGVTNRELNEIGFRYGARLWELRKQGFDIKTVAEGEGAFRFILRAEPAQIKLVPSDDWYTQATGKPRPTGLPNTALPLFDAGVQP